MTWAAVIWPTSEAWQWRRGEPIQIAGIAHPDRGGASEEAAELAATLIRPLALPLRAYVVEVGDRGELVDGPWIARYRLDNPARDVWRYGRDGDAWRIERGDTRAGDEWEPYDGPRPPHPSCTVSRELLESGPCRIGYDADRSVRVVSHGLEAYDETDAEFSADVWEELAALQAVGAHVAKRWPSVRPMPGTPKALARSALVGLRQRLPAADPWVSACEAAL